MTCVECGRAKPAGDFYLHKGKPRARCKICHLAEGKRRRDANPERYREIGRLSARRQRAANPEKQWADNLKKYGITPEQYTKKLDSQEGRCAICKETCKTGYRLVVDHDHACCPIPPHIKPTCGECNRDLLCRSCNVGIGNLQERKDYLMSAIDYLTRWGL